MKKLRIAIATAGRFHVLDLARELHALGYDVKLYSYVPKARAILFGLPPECHVSLFAFVLPALAWAKIAPKIWPAARGVLLEILLNLALKFRLQACDVFICMSGIFLEAPRFARRRFNPRIWLERGSRHILSQAEILAKMPGAEKPTARTILRELAGYTLADRIVVASTHVVESFRCDEAAHRKLFRNPYGVDLSMFPLCNVRRKDAHLNLLYVGAWSLRKGCDVLVSAVRQTPNVILTHVGTIADVPFPDEPGFLHIDSVPQHDLSRFFCAADAFVLASREDGFGVVLSQALASGLPIICTDRTGGQDLKFTTALAERIIIVPHDDVPSLADALANMRDRVARGQAPAPLARADREALSWAAYARRYHEELQRDLDVV